MVPFRGMIGLVGPELSEPQGFRVFFQGFPLKRSVYGFSKKSLGLAFQVFRGLGALGFRFGN